MARHILNVRDGGCAGQKDYRREGEVDRDRLPGEQREAEREETGGHPCNEKPATGLCGGEIELGENADLDGQSGEQICHEHGGSSDGGWAV